MRSIRLLLCAVFTLGMALAADVTGKWSVSVNGPDGNPMTLNYEFKQDGTKLTGTVAGPTGARPIQNGTVEGDKISFTVTFNGGNGDMKIGNEGTVKGDEIVITVKVNGEPFGAPVTLKKSK